MKQQAREDCLDRFTWSAAAHRLMRVYVVRSA